MIVPEDQGGWRRLGGRVVRQVQWARKVGLGRLIEEDQLDPRHWLRVAWRRWRWEFRGGVERGNAAPVYLVGMQRSGTNMVARALQSFPEVVVYNENSRRAFRNYRLRDDDCIARLVRRSRSRYVVFKPLCDSHQVTRLLDALPVPNHGSALWVYRDVEGRARSALAKFGDVNLRILREIASGNGRDRWQAQELSRENLKLLQRFDYSTMTPQTAAALFWYLRNSLYFDLGLDVRRDVLLCSYDRMVSDPHNESIVICRFLGLPERSDMLRHSDLRSPRESATLAIDPTVGELCRNLAIRLDHAVASHRHPKATPSAGNDGWQAGTSREHTIS